ncbi:apoptosis regulatory protein Siva-like [Penaeus indicus]|uniref:apoptosis regulatory protein Siva-like n=1 Tax=Penaeus indicus TaxID=29960 RepID=UPI00300C4629
MPKRACPFEDSFSPQMKLHVGAKEVDNGVMRSEKMKAVYDRTLSLLYSGAKNVMNNNTVERMEMGIEAQKVKSANTLHQMCLTAQGTLARPQPFSKNMEMQPKNRSSCGHSPSIRQSVITSCSYCESQLCDSCIKSCHFCQGIFCPKCSLTVYQEEEKVLCLSCC